MGLPSVARNAANAPPPSGPATVAQPLGVKRTAQAAFEGKSSCLFEGVYSVDVSPRQAQLFPELVRACLFATANNPFNSHRGVAKLF